MFDGGKTETIVLDEVQCKYCLRTVNQKMDLVKHYRFCLGLKGAKKSTTEVSTVYVMADLHCRTQIRIRIANPMAT